MKKMKIALFALLLASTMLYATTWKVDCNNATHLKTLHIPKGDCLAMKSVWDAFGEGEGWRHTDFWGDPSVSAEEWYGVTLHESGEGIKWFDMADNNLFGEIPAGVESFESLHALSFTENHISGKLPLASIGKIKTLQTFGMSNVGFSGPLPTFAEFANTEIHGLYLRDNNFTGPIPQEWAELPSLEFIYLSDNNLSGPLPDLSSLNKLEKFEIYHNQFTFADIEPQMGWLKALKKEGGAYYARQRGFYPEDLDSYSGKCHYYAIDERDHTVYFDTTLRIEPRVPKNTYSNHDFFAWYKYEINHKQEDVSDGGKRIYIKPDASKEDEGYYYYEANNSVVTFKMYSPEHNSFSQLYLHYCGTHFEDGIHAIHDNAPKVENTHPKIRTSIGAAYSYSSKISDKDSGDTLSVTATALPLWLTLDFNQTKFTLSGTPDESEVGDYDINLTVTDGKIPVAINYLLHVAQEDEQVLPENFSQEGNTITNTETGNKISSSESELVVTEENSVIFGGCNYKGDDIKAFISLSSEGVLHTGYQNCSAQSKKETLSTKYPNASHATLSSDTPNIMVEFDLTNKTKSITIGAE